MSPKCCEWVVQDVFVFLAFRISSLLWEFGLLWLRLVATRLRENKLYTLQYWNKSILFKFIELLTRLGILWTKEYLCCSSGDNEDLHLNIELNGLCSKYFASSIIMYFHLCFAKNLLSFMTTLYEMTITRNMSLVGHMGMWILRILHAYHVHHLNDEQNFQGRNKYAINKAFHVTLHKNIELSYVYEEWGRYVRKNVLILLTLLEREMGHTYSYLINEQAYRYSWHIFKIHWAAKILLSSFRRMMNIEHVMGAPLDTLT